MKPKHVAAVGAAGVVVAGAVVWWAARPGAGPQPQPAQVSGEPASVAAAEPAPALELVGRVEGLQPGSEGERSFGLRLARPDPPAAESADAAHLRESFGVVVVRLRPAAVVTDAAGAVAPLCDGQLVRVRSVRSQPKPTDPPVWFPDNVRVLQATTDG